MISLKYVAFLVLGLAIMPSMAMAVIDPPVNETNCAAISQATIGGSVDIPLAGNSSVIEFSVSYNGMTVSGIPAGNFNLSGINGAVGSVLVSAEGFDAGGIWVSDQITCDLDFVAPSCSSSQDPDSTVSPVDFGTVISLNLASTGAISSLVDGVSMTPDTNPMTNNTVNWSATHVAVADNTLYGTVTNPDGETSICSWDININCVDPLISSVAEPGSSPIDITGTEGCQYNVRMTEQFTGTVTEYYVAIGSGGIGSLNVIVPYATLIEAGQISTPFVASDSFLTALPPAEPIPTLGWWQLYLMMSLLGLMGLAALRPPVRGKHK